MAKAPSEGEAATFDVEVETFQKVMKWCRQRDLLDPRDYDEGYSADDIIQALDDHEEGCAASPTVVPVAVGVAWGDSGPIPGQSFGDEFDAQPVAPSKEPVGYLFELCCSHEHDRWSGPMYSECLPKAEDVRNVRPLVFASTAVTPVALPKDTSRFNALSSADDETIRETEER
ncbi:hypothetical protein [Mesorhizobium sp. M0129]|uniref:hypothetical protein n=1 Tax=Mesorhizobium sp. M0129 TaxID=2956886 RepID=UPI00333DD8AC